MKLIGKIRSHTYLDDAFIWWDKSKTPDGKTISTLAFYLFFIFIKIRFFPGFKIKINTLKP